MPIEADGDVAIDEAAIAEAEAEVAVGGRLLAGLGVTAAHREPAPAHLELSQRIVGHGWLGGLLRPLRLALRFLRIAPGLLLSRAPPGLGHGRRGGGGR